MDEMSKLKLYFGADDTPHEPLSQEAQAWARVRVLEAVIAEIVTFTEWAKDTDLSGDDWLTEFRHPEQVTAKCVWDMAQKAGKL